jgi:hypothetical protein
METLNIDKENFIERNVMCSKLMDARFQWTRFIQLQEQLLEGHPQTNVFSILVPFSETVRLQSSETLRQ